MLLFSYENLRKLQSKGMVNFLLKDRIFLSYLLFEIMIYSIKKKQSTTFIFFVFLFFTKRNKQKKKSPIYQKNHQMITLVVSVGQPDTVLL